ncbi:MAG TPA: DUF3309 family protein [Candidatus Acidoferrales bacterium]|nr:DUF3309 family protein [Candidatus Acidoferrales bacterium]
MRGTLDGGTRGGSLCFAAKEETTLLRLLLLVFIVLMLIGSLPTWPYSVHWGYYPSGGLGLILFILLILAVLDRI